LSSLQHSAHTNLTTTFFATPFLQPFNYNRPSTAAGTQSIGFISFHGDDDKAIPYEGGGAPPGGNAAYILLDSNANTNEIWRTQNGCQSSPTTTSVPTATSTAQHSVWSCPSTFATEHYVVAGGGHAIGEIDGQKLEKLALDFFATVEVACAAAADGTFQKPGGNYTSTSTPTPTPTPTPTSTVPGAVGAAIDKGTAAATTVLSAAAVESFTNCASYAAWTDNVALGLTANDSGITDWYRPFAGKTLCEMIATGVGGKYNHLQNGVFVEALAQHGALLGGVVAPADGTARSHATFWGTRDSGNGIVGACGDVAGFACGRSLHVQVQQLDAGRKLLKRAVVLLCVCVFLFINRS
jgi:hypothetical protein